MMAKLQPGLRFLALVDHTGEKGIVKFVKLIWLAPLCFFYSYKVCSNVSLLILVKIH